MNNFFWTHPSVLKLAQQRDPVEAVLERAREMILEAAENGWHGPPFDPFELARRRNIQVVPREDVGEARLTQRGGRLELDYNPLKPRNRVRYSIAHEVAHTIFPDFAEKARYRGAPRPDRPDDWQLEILCNLAAAEFLMPVSTLNEDEIIEPTIDTIAEWRTRYEVSLEAALLRMLSLTTQDIFVFCASKQKQRAYEFSYVLSKTGPLTRCYGSTISSRSPINNCVSMGYTDKGDDVWPCDIGSVYVECMGIAPYPGTTHPRVVGLARNRRSSNSSVPTIKEVRGNALEPRGTGRRILAHVVNDKARSWGAGFGKQVAERFPEVARGFRLEMENGSRLRLGEIFTTTADQEDVIVVQLVAQHGYGDSETPRLRYLALRDCLRKLSEFAKEQSATVHMPPIGTGFGGGSWVLIRDLVEQEVCRRGVPVTVYNIGKSRPQQPQSAQMAFI